MSDLTPCNYCCYQALRRRAKDKKARVYKRYEGGWCTIYIVPRGQNLDPKKHFAVSYMSLPYSCHC